MIAKPPASFAETHEINDVLSIDSDCQRYHKLIPAPPKSPVERQEHEWNKELETEIAPIDCVKIPPPWQSVALQEWNSDFATERDTEEELTAK